MSGAKFPMIVAVAVLVTPVTSRAQDSPRYEVVINGEAQYAIWVAGETAPPGWELTGRTGSLRQAMDYIEEVWTDMRPLSVRRLMSERRMNRDETMYVVLRREEGRQSGIAPGYYGYMLWPEAEPYPQELTPIGKSGTFRETSDYIEEVWTDMRPYAIRNRFPIRTPSTAALAAEIPTGEWRVTRLTGRITSTGAGPAPPAGLCENFSEEHEPLLENSFVELGLLGSPDGRAAEKVESIVSAFQDLPTAINPPDVDPARWFVFHFEFDNGYFDNEVLSGEVVAQTIRGFMGAFSFYIGSWIPGDGTVVGLFGATTGGGTTGVSLFRVVGRFASPRRLVGQWYYQEESSLLGCTTASLGSGDWEAEAPAPPGSAISSLDESAHPSAGLLAPVQLRHEAP